MGRCENNCVICNEEFCDGYKATCALCGRQCIAGDMWTIYGQRFCSSCVLARPLEVGEQAAKTLLTRLEGKNGKEFTA